MSPQLRVPADRSLFTVGGRTYAWEDVVLTATVLIGPFLTALFADDEERKDGMRRGAFAADLTHYVTLYPNQDWFVHASLGSASS